MVRQLCYWLGVTMVLVLRTAAPAGDFVWLEGEKPSSSNYRNIDVTSWAGHAYLSDGKWLRIQIAAGDVEKTVPKEGIVLGYDFVAPSAGKYEVWNRIGYEFVRSPFSWRVDNGPWQEVKPTDLTIDLMLLTDWNELAWCKCGLADLAQGKHRLEIRLQRWFKTANNQREEQQIFYCSDALCISKDPFRPNGKFKPGTPYQDKQDTAAGKHVFKMAAGGKAGERVETPLTGLWQIARWDELTVKEGERARPIESMPGAEQLHWYGIDVPGDRNEKRPDFSYCHRYLYRTRVEAPADLQGRAFFLHFGSTSLIASVIVNGQFCGANAAPFTIWDCDVTKAIQAGKTNEILVAVKDAYYAATTPRDIFNMPMGFFQFQGASNRFDFPVWSHMQNGIIEPVSLVAVGNVYVSDVFAIPSLKKRQLGLEITLHNASSAPVSVVIGNECVPAAGGPAEKRFTDQQVALATGQDKVVKLAEGWQVAEALVARRAAAIRRGHNRQTRRPRDRHAQNAVRFPRVDVGPRPVHSQRRAVPRPRRSGRLRRWQARRYAGPVDQEWADDDALLGHGLEGHGPGRSLGLSRPWGRGGAAHGDIRRRGRQLRPGGNRQGKRQGRDPRPQGPLRPLGQSVEGPGPRRAEPSQHYDLVDRERDHVHQLAQLGPGAVGRAGHPRHRPGGHGDRSHASDDDRRWACHDGPVDARQRCPLRRERHARLSRRGLYLRQAVPPATDDLEVRHDQARFPGREPVHLGQRALVLRRLAGRVGLLGAERIGPRRVAVGQDGFRRLPLGRYRGVPFLDGRQHRWRLQFLAAGGRLVPPVELDLRLRQPSDAHAQGL